MPGAGLAAACCQERENITFQAVCVLADLPRNFTSGGTEHRADGSFLGDDLAALGHAVHWRAVGTVLPCSAWPAPSSVHGPWKTRPRLPTATQRLEGPAQRRPGSSVSGRRPNCPRLPVRVCAAREMARVEEVFMFSGPDIIESPTLLK